MIQDGCRSAAAAVNGTINLSLHSVRGAGMHIAVAHETKSNNEDNSWVLSN